MPTPAPAANWWLDRPHSPRLPTISTPGSPIRRAPGRSALCGHPTRPYTRAASYRHAPRFRSTWGTQHSAQAHGLSFHRPLTGHTRIGNHPSTRPTTKHATSDPQPAATAGRRVDRTADRTAGRTAHAPGPPDRPERSALISHTTTGHSRVRTTHHRRPPSADEKRTQSTDATRPQAARRHRRIRRPQATLGPTTGMIRRGRGAEPAKIAPSWPRATAKYTGINRRHLHDCRPVSRLGSPQHHPLRTSTTQLKHFPTLWQQMVCSPIARTSQSAV